MSPLLQQIADNYEQTAAGTSIDDREHTLTTGSRGEQVRHTLDHFLLRAATNPIGHTKLQNEWASEGIRLSQRYWPTVKMLLDSLNLVLRWRAVAPFIGWNSINLEPYDADVIQYIYQESQIIVSHLSHREPTHTSVHVEAATHVWDSLQPGISSQLESEAAVADGSRDRRLFLRDARYERGTEFGHRNDAYIKAQAQFRFARAMRSARAGHLVTFHVPHVDVGDVVQLPDAGQWRIQTKRITYADGELLDTLSLQAP